MEQRQSLLPRFLLRAAASPRRRVALIAVPPRLTFPDSLTIASAVCYQ